MLPPISVSQIKLHESPPRLGVRSTRHIDRPMSTRAVAYRNALQLVLGGHVALLVCGCALLSGDLLKLPVRSSVRGPLARLYSRSRPWPTPRAPRPATVVEFPNLPTSSHANVHGEHGSRR